MDAVLVLVSAVLVPVLGYFILVFAWRRWMANQDRRLFRDAFGEDPSPEVVNSVLTEMDHEISQLRRRRDLLSARKFSAPSFAEEKGLALAIIEKEARSRRLRVVAERLGRK